MIEYTPATPADDAELRSLLRTPPMQKGWVDMTLEREPCFFAGSFTLGRETAVLARHRGQLVGMYTVTRQRLYVNGRPDWVAYLGGLRVVPAWRNRIQVLRQGFRSIQRLLPPSPWSLTSLANNNRRARRVLESGLPGLPRYQPVGELVTVALARGRRGGPEWSPLAPQELPELLEFHHRQSCHRQFAPVLDEAMVNRVGLENFRVQRDSRGIRACAAWWNQQSVRQLVARRYSPWVGALRPLYNGFASLLGWVPLPRAGDQLDQTFLAFLNSSGWPRNLSSLLTSCPTRVAVVGVSPTDPLCRRSCYRLHTLLYRVGEGADLQAGPAQPEAALL